MYLQSFIEILIKAAGSKHKVAEYLQEKMHLTKDGAYRRLRGVTALHFEEVVQLASHFNVSLDQLLHLDGHHIAMEYYPLILHNTDYFEIFNKSFSQINIEEATLNFLVKKISLYYYMMRDLTYFNSVYYYKMISEAGFEMDTFSIEKLQPLIGIIDHIRMLGMDVFRLYQDIPSIEIFTPYSFHNMLMRIQYATDSGFFENKEDAFNLCDDVKRLMEHFKHQATTGKKFPVGNLNEAKASFTMYYFDESQVDGLIFLDSPTNPKLFNTVNMGDIFITDDPGVMQRTRIYFKNTLRLSEKISGENERGRNRVFNQYFKKVDNLRQYINDKFTTE